MRRVRIFFTTAGIFKSAVKHGVTALCDAHFPKETSKNSWVIAFYNEKEFDWSDVSFIMENF